MQERAVRDGGEGLCLADRLDGGATRRALPSALALVVAALALACATSASAAVSVVSWGENTYGQLGDGHHGAGTRKEAPEWVCAPEMPCPGTSHLENVIEVSAGGEHSLALLGSGEVVAWGRGKEGALGDEETGNEYQPVYVCKVSPAPVTTGPGCQGSAGIPNRLKNVIAISAGNASANIALLSNGDVVTWGSNKGGPLGIGERSPPVKFSSAPVQPCEPGTDSTPCGGKYLTGIREVSAAPAHDVAVGSSDGEAVSWGADKVGQLGRGDWYKTSPGINRAEEVCETEYSGDYGSIFAEPFGPLAGKNKTPATCSGLLLGQLSGVTGVSFGLQHNLALIYGFPPGHKGKEGENEAERKQREEEEIGKHNKEGKEGINSVVAWGYNDDGQMGDNEPAGGPNHCWKSPSRPCSEVPIPVCEAEYVYNGGTQKPCVGGEGLQDASAVAAGGSHSLALVNGENVVAWGEAGHGTLGNNQLSNSYFPEYVCKVGSAATPPHCGAGYEYLTEVSAIAAGEFHNLALLDKGEVVAWGENADGQLGNTESGAQHNTPVYVCEVKAAYPCPGHLTGVTEVSAGTNHSLAVGAFPSGAPVWYKKGIELPKNGTHVAVPTSGGLSFGYGTTKCKLKDSEQIWNPAGAVAGEDEITLFTLTGCKSSLPCPVHQHLEVLSEGLNWKTHLVAGPPVRDEIENIKLTFQCSGGGLLEKFHGSLTPEVGNGELVFTPGSGELEGSTPIKTTVTGSDKLKKITAH